MSTAIATRTVLPLVPTTADEAWRLSEMLAKSSLLPDSLRGKANDVMVIVMHGLELGIKPMQAVREINVIAGKPVASAGLMLALCVQRTDRCRYFSLVDSSTDAATYETQRVDTPTPTRLTYTMAEAQKAGHGKKDNYAKHPAAMLRARCAAALARAVYPDLVSGLYVHEEGLEERPRAEVLERPRTLAELTAPPAKEPAQMLREAMASPTGTADTGAGCSVKLIDADEAAEIAAQERGE